MTIPRALQRKVLSAFSTNTDAVARNRNAAEYRCNIIRQLLEVADDTVAKKKLAAPVVAFTLKDIGAAGKSDIVYEWRKAPFAPIREGKTGEYRASVRSGDSAATVEFWTESPLLRTKKYCFGIGVRVGEDQLLRCERDNPIRVTPVQPFSFSKRERSVDTNARQLAAETVYAGDLTIDELAELRAQLDAKYAEAVERAIRRKYARTAGKVGLVLLAFLGLLYQDRVGTAVADILRWLTRSFKSELPVMQHPEERPPAAWADAIVRPGKTLKGNPSFVRIKIISPRMVGVSYDTQEQWACPKHSDEREATYSWLAFVPGDIAAPRITDKPWVEFSFRQQHTEAEYGGMHIEVYRDCSRETPPVHFNILPQALPGDRVLLPSKADPSGGTTTIMRPETNRTPIAVPPGARELPSPGDPRAGSPPPAPTGSR